jgi:hypothetical protein
MVEHLKKNVKEWQVSELIKNLQACRFITAERYEDACLAWMSKIALWYCQGKSGKVF